MNGQIKARRQNAPDRFNVTLCQGRDHGGPEIKSLWEAPGQIENPAQVLLDPPGPGQAAGQRGILVPRTLDVHGEHVHQPGRE